MAFKHFEPYDLIYTYNLRMVPDVFFQVVSKEDRTLEDIIDIYNAEKYIDDNIICVEWKKDFKDKLHENKITIERVIGEYFNVSNFKIITSEIRLLNPYNYNDFFDIIEKYEKSFIGSNERMNKLIESFSHNCLSSLLKQKKMVKKYGEIISKYILSNYKNTEVIINACLSKDEIARRMILPKEFTNVDRDRLFQKYIDSDNPSINCLSMIELGRFKPDVSDIVKFNSEARKAFIEKSLFSKTNGISMGVKSIITPLSENQSPINREISGDSEIIKIDANWIKNNLDYPTVMQNLIYVFNFVDSDFRISALVKKNEVGILEGLISQDYKDKYPDNLVAFKYKEMRAITLFNTYYNYLENNEIHFEKVLKWFLSKYLIEEFNISGFNIKVPGSETSYYEKNLIMHPQFHRVLKQYKTYFNNGKVIDYIVDRSKTPKLEELNSLSSNKYVYIKNDDMKRHIEILFSLTFDNGKEYICDKLIGGVQKSYFISHNTKLLQYFLDKGIIKEKDGIIKYTSLYHYYLYKKLYLDNSINCFEQNKAMLNLIDDQIMCGHLCYFDKLLSKEEADYFSYYLDDRFANGIALRNKYVHGSTENMSEEEHKRNYMILMYLYGLLIIKINEELEHFSNSKTISLN